MKPTFFAPAVAAVVLTVALILGVDSLKAQECTLSMYECVMLEHDDARVRINGNGFFHNGRQWVSVRIEAGDEIFVGEVPVRQLVGASMIGKVYSALLIDGEINLIAEVR